MGIGKGIFALVLAVGPLVAQGGAAPVTRDLTGTVTGIPEKQKARVTLWLNDMKKHSLEAIAEGFADANGAFRLPAVPWFSRQQWGSHSCMLIARAGDRIAMVGLRGDDAKTTDLGLALAPAVELHGVLRDESTNAPIANAWVWPAIFGADMKIWFTEPMLPWRAVTDADGKFTIRGLPECDGYRLRAGGPEHAKSSIEVKAPKEPIDVALSRGARITGTVRLPDGKPAKRVLVCGAANGAGFGTALSDDAGHFELTSLPSDTYKVWAEAPDLTVVAVTGITVGPGETAEDQTVQLVHGGFIQGRIVDKATGQPFVPEASTDVAMYGPARGQGGACECTPVLPDGTFRIRAPAGTNRIYLRAAGRGYSEPTESVIVVEGQETKVEWQLERRV